MRMNKLNNPFHHTCNESHHSHHSHDGRRPYCLSRSQQQLSHFPYKDLILTKKWGCSNNHKSLSLVFVITKTTRSRDREYQSTARRCEGVGWRDPFWVCCSRRLWVKRVMLSAHAVGLWWPPFAVKSGKRCLQLAGLLSYDETRLHQGLKPMFVLVSTGLTSSAAEDMEEMGTDCPRMRR